MQHHGISLNLIVNLKHQLLRQSANKLNLYRAEESTLCSAMYTYKLNFNKLSLSQNYNRFEKCVSSTFLQLNNRF